MALALTVDRTIGTTGRGEKIIRLPASWNDPRLSKGSAVRLTFDGERVTIHLLAEA
jgi:hypothetical protein